MEIRFFLLIFLALFAVFFAGCTQPNTGPTGCPLDEKACPNGGSVFRNPALNCDFNPCQNPEQKYACSDDSDCVAFSDGCTPFECVNNVFPYTVVSFCANGATGIGPEYYCKCSNNRCAAGSFLPLDTNCPGWRADIKKRLEAANFCSLDSDCKILPLGGSYIEFGCYYFVNIETNFEARYKALNDYTSKCTDVIGDCTDAPVPVCVEGKCVEFACKKEGEAVPVIPNPPVCCEGLALIPPKEEQIVGIYGFCSAKCGNAACDSETETNYNCPADCPVVLQVMTDADAIASVQGKPVGTTLEYKRPKDAECIVTVTETEPEIICNFR